MATDHAGTVDPGSSDTEPSAPVYATVDFIVLFVLVTAVLLAATVVMVP